MSERTGVTQAGCAAQGCTCSSAVSLERMDIVVVGHVDHGKSTVIGRLMADTGSLPEGKLDQVKAMCARNARPFEYAFLLDALKNEQAQGITIDTARCFFKTSRRHYIIHDAPGHIEFLKNMITGASRAEAALLVIDAHEGVAENSRRHGYILSMLGIRQVAVIVNKMDVLGWDEDAFNDIATKYGEFLARIGVKPTSFIPASAREGGNIVVRSDEAPWYEGPTVLEQVESFPRLDDAVERPFRMPLQDVYKFTDRGDDRRIFAGTIESGRIRPGDDVVFLPSEKRSRVASIEVLEGKRPSEASAGETTGFTLETQVYVKPGELVVREAESAPLVSTRLRANVFWMGRVALAKGRRYVLRIGTAKVPAELEQVISVLDASDLSSTEGATEVARHEVAEIVLRTARPVAFDTADALETTSRFVIVAGYDIAGCGTALEALSSDAGASEAEWPFTAGLVGQEERVRRNRHAGHVVVFFGERTDEVADIAARVERRLFDIGAQSYFLGATRVTNLTDTLARDERLEYVGRVAWAMADSGSVLVTALGALDRFDLDRLRSIARPHEVFVVGLGDAAAGLDIDLVLPEGVDAAAAVSESVRSLAGHGVLPEYDI